MNGDEVWAAHIPMRLLGLGMQINGRSQMLIEQFNRLGADGFV
jgi:hypothetical protein